MEEKVLVTLAASSGKRNVTVWRLSVRLSVPSFSNLNRARGVFLYLIVRAGHTQRDSPGGSMRRG